MVLQLATYLVDYGQMLQLGQIIHNQSLRKLGGHLSPLAVPVYIMICFAPGLANAIRGSGSHHKDRIPI